MVRTIAPLLSLKAARFRIDFSTVRRWRMWGKESALRGRIGFNLKRTCCPYPNFRRRDCDECVLSARCLYLKLFAPGPSEPQVTSQGRLMAGPTSVRPYVIALEGPEGRPDLMPGESASVVCTFFGPGVQYAGLFLEAAAGALSSFQLSVDDLALLAPEGYDTKRHDTAAAFALSDWVGVDAAGVGARADEAASPSADRLGLEFITPTRLFSKGRQRRQRVSLALIVKVLVRRLRDLKRCYGEDRHMGQTGDLFYKAANAVRVKDDKLWYSHRKRYSHRQGQNVFLHGLRGRICFQGPFHPFLSLLRAGEMIHIGKGVSCGAGRMRVNGWCEGDKS